MQFKNPSNGYVEEVSSVAWLWVLLFGTIYFAVKSVWNHAFLSLVFALVTAGVSWLVYPFFATDILRKHYLKKGWIEVGNATPGAVDSYIQKKTEGIGVGRLFVFGIIALIFIPVIYTWISRLFSMVFGT